MVLTSNLWKGDFLFSFFLPAFDAPSSSSSSCSITYVTLKHHNVTCKGQDKRREKGGGGVLRGARPERDAYHGSHNTATRSKHGQPEAKGQRSRAPSLPRRSPFSNQQFLAHPSILWVVKHGGFHSSWKVAIPWWNWRPIRWVDVPLPVTQVIHQLCRGIPKVQRDGRRGLTLHRLDGQLVRGVHCDGLLGKRTVNRGLS